MNSTMNIAFRDFAILPWITLLFGALFLLPVNPILAAVALAIMYPIASYARADPNITPPKFVTVVELMSIIVLLAVMVSLINLFLPLLPLYF